MSHKEEKKKTSVGKSTGRSKTGKPLEQIDVNPQHNLDDAKTQRENAVVLTPPPIEEGKALTIAQRQKRSRIMRRLEPKLVRKRQMAKKRMAPKEALQRRAEVAAREILKKRFSGMKGVPYAELSVAQKIQVDKRLEGKVALIKRLAARLLPRIRRKEFERLSSYYKGKQMSSMHSEKEAMQTEQFNQQFENLFSQLLNKEENNSIQQMASDYSPETLIDVIEAMINDLEENHPFKGSLVEMFNKVAPVNPVYEALMSKSEKSGIDFSILEKVFNRGVETWDGSRGTQQQFAFDRVNSYIAEGKAYELDKDLREAGGAGEEGTKKLVKKYKKDTPCQNTNEVFGNFFESDFWDKPNPKKKSKSLTPAQKAKAKARAKAAGRPYPNLVDNAWASNLGEEKECAPGQYYCNTDKMCKPIPKGHKVDKDGMLVKEETKMSMNESFVLDKVAGIGQMVTAADAGIEIKAGFVNYPGVEELSSLLQMESTIKHRFSNFMHEAVDDEGAMAKSELLSMIKKAQALASKMSSDKQLDGWVQSKITKAADYINSVHDFLMNNKQEVDK